MYIELYSILYGIIQFSQPCGIDFIIPILQVSNKIKKSYINHSVV